MRSHSTTYFQTHFSTKYIEMADTASVSALQDKQRKLSDRLDLMERTIHSMFTAFVGVLGDKVPNKMQKIAKEWEELDVNKEVVVSKVKNLIVVAYIYISIQLHSLTMAKSALKDSNVGM